MEAIMARTLRVNGYDMAYVESGAGVPLLLVHGTLCDYRYWTLQMEPLARDRRVIAVSLRHCYPERRDGSGDDFTIAQHAADVGAFIAALDAGPVHLLGHSRGGRVTFDVARHFPDRIRSLILADPGGTLDDELTPPAGASTGQATPYAALQACAQLVKQGEIEQGLEKFVELVSGPGIWSRMPEPAKNMLRDNARTLIGQIAAPPEPFSRAAIEAVAAPTLVLVGERSPAFFHQIAAALLRHLRDGRRAIIERAGHAMSIENPAGFNAAVTDFLDAHAG
jgi:pimeloyl-ACP methyl ester carboxylesterase